MTDPGGAPEGAPEGAVTGAAGTEAEWRRLHPLTPLLRGGLVLIVVGGIVLANFRDHLLGLFIAEEYLDALGPNEGDLIDFIVAERLLLVALLVLFGVLAVIVFAAWLSWRFRTFRITAEAVEEHSGILFRQHRRAPLDRIQSVNLQRPLLARLLGLTAVDVQTGGQDGRVALRYLGHQNAKRVREQILLGVADRHSAAAAGGAPPATVLSVAPAPGSTTVPLESRIRDITDLDVDPVAREAGSLVRVPVGRLIASILLGSEMLVIVVIAVVIVVLSIWASPFLLVSVLPLVLVTVGVLIGQFNRGYGFVISRSVDGIRVGAGLTSTTTETIPFGRIHAIEARQPIGWRPFGWWKVRITTAGHAVSQGGQNRLQNTVLPVGRTEEVIRVFSTVLPGAASSEQADALRVALHAGGKDFQGAGPRAGWVLWFGRKRAGLRIDDGGGEPMLSIRRGALTRSLAVMPIVRAQSVQLRRAMVHRLLGLASVQAHTVLGPVQMEMRGLALEQARTIFEELSRTAVRVQGEESVRRFASRRRAGDAGEGGTR